jgi:hypothetical protein
VEIRKRRKEKFWWRGFEDFWKKKEVERMEKMVEWVGEGLKLRPFGGGIGWEEEKGGKGGVGGKCGDGEF